MRGTCSICANQQSAQLCNEYLLEGKLTLIEIAEKIGSSKSAVGRHSLKCFREWKAERLRAKRGKSNDGGYMVVQWPGEPVPELQPDDTLIVVEYQQPNVAYIAEHGNPRALPLEFIDQLHEVAVAEDAERTESLKLAPASE